MLQKTKDWRIDRLAYPTIFMKTKNLISKNHDIYEKTGSYRICEGFEENSGLLIPESISNRCGAGTVEHGKLAHYGISQDVVENKRKKNPARGYAAMFMKMNNLLH